VHGWSWLVGLSLVRGPLHVALLSFAAAAFVGLVVLRRGRPWWLRAVAAAVVATGAVVLGLRTYLDVTKPWPDPLPAVVYAWVGAGVLALLLLVLGWRHQRWLVRGLGAVAVLLVVLGAADGIDSVFGAYPTVGTALQLAPSDQVPASSVLGRAGSAPADLPPHGAVTQVDIPATRSGFAARPAWLYLPPAYLTARRPALPVLMMIGGQPGGPRDWLDGGQLAQRMDAFAAAHQGRAPVVVMPDGTGSEIADPMCLDSARGRADTYLSQDVVDWVSTHLRVPADHAHWAVGGFSYGGTCAFQLAVAHPDLFPTFFDTSGQEEPTLGSRARTVAVAFGGDQAAFSAVDPLQELRRRSYAGSAGFLAAGAQDSEYLPQQRTVVTAARAAGMTITDEVLPGRHEWRVWGQAFQDAIPWLATRLGLTS
jgi:S-formylglutathione hydrolase FrmB